VVTTYVAPIQLDEISYEVRVTNGDPHNKNHIKAVAHASGVHFLSARNLLKQDDPLVFKGEARKVVELRRDLQEAGLRLDIRPKFPY